MILYSFVSDFLWISERAMSISFIVSKTISTSTIVSFRLVLSISI